MGTMSEEVKAKNPSIWGMIWSPTEQFERIKERPKIWGALAIVTVLFVIGMYLTSLGDPMVIEGMPEIPEEQLAADFYVHNDYNDHYWTLYTNLWCANLDSDLFNHCQNRSFRS